MASPTSTRRTNNGSPKGSPSKQKGRSSRGHSPGTKRAAILGIISFLVFGSAFLYKTKLDKDALRLRLDATLDSLLRIESSLQEVNHDAKVAIGYGSCLDIVVPALSVLDQDFCGDFVPRINSLDGKSDSVSDSINNKEQLLSSFSQFFSAGAAAERYISDKQLFKEIVQKARESKLSKTTLGGNAPVMANRMFTEGIRNVLLGSVRTVDLERLLPKGIKITGSGDIVNDKQANEVSKDDITDDIHVLLEFPAGQSWMGLTSPRANRFIVHSDDSNPRIAALESFHEAVDKFYPDLLVVSGLQMLDNFPSPDKASRIDKLSSFLQDFHMNHPDSKVHFEMASFTEPALVSQVIKDILPNADSVGMNEQEIANLDSIFSVGNISLVSNPYPRTAVVLDQMRNIFSHLDTLSGGRISRIHVHTLAFQAILVKKGSSWKETRAAAVKSALTAHRHTCGDHDIDVDKARLIMDDSFSTTDRDHRLRIQFEPQFPVPCWQESLGSTGNIGVSICVAPVLVCTEVLQTGGGGDNVSAAGLMAQI